VASQNVKLLVMTAINKTGLNNNILRRRKEQCMGSNFGACFM
jgi:hypothetical protein